MAFRDQSLRVPRIAWAVLIAIATIVVPLRIAEIVQQHKAPIFKPKNHADAVLAPSQRKPQP